jgi:hypothetical protein
MTFSITRLLDSLPAGVPLGWGAAVLVSVPSAKVNLQVVVQKEQQQ